MTFRAAYIRLTIFYVLIVMIISVGFSVAIYRISTTELERGFNRQTRSICALPGGKCPPVIDTEIQKIHNEIVEVSSDRLQLNLLYFNLLILVLSAFASYFFARKTMRPIEKMVEAQNHFTADASHELRTPLTAIRSEIEVNLRDKKLSLPQAKKLLASNLEEIGKLESLSGALLKLAKYQNKPEKNFKQVDLQQAMTEAYEKVENLAKRKSIKFDNDFEKIVVAGDRQSLTELFIILLDNAVKYSPAKSKIALSIKKEDKHAVIKVADQGQGIRAGELPYIFNRFYRADSSRCKDISIGGCDGYGLGLSIAKQIVEYHGGEISVKSTPHEGSEFTIAL